jgi:GNAT superfamily N-acetyltransferase
MSSNVAAVTGTSIGSSAPVLGDLRPETRPLQHEFALRPLRLKDVPTLAQYSAEVYRDGPVAQFVTPYASQYPTDFVRTFHQSIRQRLYNPRGLSLVACQASRPSVPLGYAQFARLGDGQGAKAYRKEHGLWARFWTFVLSWFFWLFTIAEKKLQPDRSCDPEAIKKFEGSAAEDTKLYWGDSHPERKNRWHVQSVVVSPAWQGKGIGRLMVSEVIRRAQRERVIMGLTASPAGAHLYRKLGFEMLGHFTMQIGEAQGEGIMIRYPEGYDG